MEWVALFSSADPAVIRLLAEILVERRVAHRIVDGRGMQRIEVTAAHRKKAEGIVSELGRKLQPKPAPLPETPPGALERAVFGSPKQRARFALFMVLAPILAIVKCVDKPREPAVLTAPSGWSHVQTAWQPGKHDPRHEESPGLPLEAEDAVAQLKLKNDGTIYCYLGRVFEEAKDRNYLGLPVAAWLRQEFGDNLAVDVERARVGEVEVVRANGKLIDEPATVLGFVLSRDNRLLFLKQPPDFLVCHVPNDRLAEVLPDIETMIQRHATSPTR